MSPFDNLYTLYQALTNPAEARLLLTALGTTLGSWLLLGGALTGLGAAARRGFGLRLTRTWDWLLAFWVGWALHIGPLQLYHLTLPITPVTYWLTLGLGAAGLLSAQADARAYLRRALRAEWKLLAVGCVIAVGLAAGALGPPGEGDFALYHNQSILWAQAAPTVPGLGNLHGRLAFNNSVFLYAAMVDAGTHAGTHIAPGLLLLAGAAVGLWGVGRVFRMDLTPPALFAALWLPVVAWGASNNEHLRTPDSDFPTVLLGLVALTALFTVFKPSLNRLNTAYSVFIVVLLAAAAVTVKLSAVAFGAAAVGVAAMAYLRGGRQYLARLVGWGGGVALLLAAGWVARGYLLSGYPAYPSTLGGLSVDWRVACEAAALEADYVRSWARAPGAAPSDVLGGLGWVRPWLVRTLRLGPEVFTPLLVIAAAAVLRLRHPRRAWRGAWVALAVPLAGLGFWLLSAPDPRFTGASIWGLAFGSLAVALSEWAVHRPSTVRAAVLALSLLLSYDYLDTFRTYPPQPPDGFHSAPAPAITPVELASGLVVNMPAERAATGSGDERCYAAPLPCAPNPPTDLTLRTPGALYSGFRVEELGECR